MRNSVKNKFYNKDVIMKKNIENILNEKEKNKLFNSFPIHISIFSFVLLAGGFLYNHYFFSSISINVSNFLSLSDYVDTSITKIIYPLISTLILLIGATYTGKSIKGSYREKLFFCLLIVIVYFIVFTIIEYDNLSLSTYIAPTFIAIFLSIAYVIDMMMIRIFPNHKIIVFYVAILVVYFIAIYFIANQDSQFIKEYKKNKEYKKLLTITYEFTKNDNTTVKADLYIKSTSRYHFLYHTDALNNSYPIIIPNRQIKQIKVITRK